MSTTQTKSQTLIKSNALNNKELASWQSQCLCRFDSLSNQEKCRNTRITSTDLISFISDKLDDLDLIEEIPNKPNNTKKNKTKLDIYNMSQELLCETLFDSLLIYSEADFLDSIGFDFNLVKDSVRMIDILSTLTNKNSNYSSQMKLGFQQINTKQSITIFVSTKIFQQLLHAKTVSKLPLEQVSKRKDIGNCWSHLELIQKQIILNLQSSNTIQCCKKLQKKGIYLSKQELDKQIHQLIKIEKNQFCNRLLKCRLKKMNNDPIKCYHKLVYENIINCIKSQKKKKNNTKKQYEQVVEIQEESQKKQQQQQIIQKCLKLKGVQLSPTNSIKQNQSSENETRAKSYSVSSNDTNETQSKLDIKYFGQDTFDKKISAIYHYKVSNDLTEFGDIIAQKANSFQTHRLIAFNRIQYSLSILGFAAQLLLFGSCANGLMIEKSDVDVAISHHILNYFPYGTIKERVAYALSHVYQFISQQPWVSECTLITTAAIPVMKIQIDTSIKMQCPLGIQDDQHTFKGCPDESVKIQMDITVDTSIFQGQTGHLGLHATQLMKNWMGQVSNLYALAILLKYLYQKRQFNSTYKGGIGSYCSMVMILAYLKFYKKQEEEDLSTQLEGFINFYCKQFDQSYKGVDISKDSIFYIKQNQQSKLQVKDPINGRVMTKNTFLYPSIKQQLLQLKKKCFDNIKDQVLEHISSIEDKEQRHHILGLSPQDYFTTFQSIFPKNVFCEYDLS